MKEHGMEEQEREAGTAILCSGVPEGVIEDVLRFWQNQKPRSYERFRDGGMLRFGACGVVYVTRLLVERESAAGEAPQSLDEWRPKLESTVLTLIPDE